MNLLKLICIIIGCVACTPTHSDVARNALINNSKTAFGVHGNIFKSGSIIREVGGIEQVEQEDLKDLSDCDYCPKVPFAFSNDKWIKLKAMFQNGDSFFYFRSDTESWNQLLGREGYALIRQGQLVGSILTTVN